MADKPLRFWFTGWQQGCLCLQRRRDLGLALTRIKRAEIVLINDPVLISQLTTRKIVYDARGRIKLETKEEMAARGLKSPDRADAVIGAFSFGVQDFRTYAKRVGGSEDPFSELERYHDGMPQDDLNGDRGIQSQLERMGAWPGD